MHVKDLIKLYPPSLQTNKLAHRFKEVWSKMIKKLKKKKEKENFYKNIYVYYIMWFI